MNDEPHGLCHISEVLDWILTHQEKDLKPGSTPSGRNMTQKPS